MEGATDQDVEGGVGGGTSGESESPQPLHASIQECQSSAVHRLMLQGKVLESPSSGDFKLHCTTLAPASWVCS